MSLLNILSAIRSLRKERLVKEAGGIMVMLLSLFLCSSILQYHAGDEAVISTLPWYEVFTAAAKAVAVTIHNHFGLFGARIAVFFVRVLLGYPSVLPAMALFLVGWRLLRFASLRPAALFMIYALLMAVDLATMFGLTTLSFGDVMSGAVGRMLASFLATVIGQAGAWALTVSLGAALTFLMGRDVASRAAVSAGAFFGKLSRSIDALKEENVRRRQEREAARKQHQAEREARAAQKSEARLRKAAEREAGRAAAAATAAAAAEPAVQPVEPSPVYAVVPEAVEMPAPSQEPEPEYEPELSPAADEEPEMVIRQGVREREADLDERSMKVRTRDRVPYRFPSIDLLQRPKDDSDGIDERHLAESKARLLEKLKIYKIDVLRIATTVGPRVTLFELELAPDVKISRVKTLENDLAMALAARGIRIIAPIPGKNAIGVEIPNSKDRIVLMRSVLQVEKFKNNKLALPIVLGKNIANEVLVEDLTTMPHLLIAGATGAGKSVAINVILTSLLYARRPDELKFVLIDPKRVELSQYQKLKDHFLPKIGGLEDQIIVTDPKKAPGALRSIVREMELRYQVLEKSGARNIGEYNRKHPGEAMFYLVVVIDELADLMITAGREVEEPITRLAQMARAVGIHLIVATQRPSVDIITGIIKANFPSRIAFQVASKVDSRTILDLSGAEQLLGNGDMLFQSSRMPKPERVQCPYVSTDEVEAITAFIGSQPSHKDDYALPEVKGSNGSSSDGGQDRNTRDSMFEDAARLVVLHQQASVSLLQRRLRLGFSRAGRVMDQLEQSGIVGAADGSKAREVLVQNEDSLELLLRNLD